MKAIVYFNGETVTKLAKEQLKSWDAEYRNYYRIHHRQISTIGESHPYEGMYCGACWDWEKIAEKVFDDMNVDINTFDAFNSWLTSGGNFTGIGIKDNEVTVLLSGARHGLRTPFYELKDQSKYVYLETHMPEAAHPYTTRDLFANVSLENALACKGLYNYDMPSYELILHELNAPSEMFMTEHDLIDYIVDQNIKDKDLDWDDYCRRSLAFRAVLYTRGLASKYARLLKANVNQISAMYYPDDAEYQFYFSMPYSVRKSAHEFINEVA